MNTINDRRLSEILAPSGVAFDPKLLDAIRSYIDLLLQWNRKISLTGIEDPEEIVRLHFGESFFAASSFCLSRGRLADVGSGAGFPGIPIKMLSPELELSLIESNAKKAVFLSEVVRRLDLKPAEVLHTRMEDISVEDTPRFDFVTARAVGNHRALLMWARRHLTRSGRLILFLGEDSAEISREHSWSWSMKRIPDSDRRVLLVGSPE